ncbi:hypothetical protein VPH35_021906 [Triticum aestivum]
MRQNFCLRFEKKKIPTKKILKISCLLQRSNLQPSSLKDKNKFSKAPPSDLTWLLQVPKYILMLLGKRRNVPGYGGNPIQLLESEFTNHILIPNDNSDSSLYS